MKTIILLIAIMMLDISCKKQKSVEPAPEPVKVEKSFSAKISFHQDSIGTYYNNTIANPMYIHIFITDIPYHDGVNTNGHVIFNNGQTCFPIGFVGSTTFKTYPIKYTINVNDSFDYYINIITTYQTYLGTTYGRVYSKHYVFNEGDNGVIDFKAIP